MRRRKPKTDLGNMPREIALGFVRAGIVMFILGECSSLLHTDGKVTIDDFQQVADEIGPATVKVLSMHGDGTTELLPLSTGFVVHSEQQVGYALVFVVTRLTSVQHAGPLAVCYYPYWLKDDAPWPTNLASAEIVGRDQMRDLALLQARVTNELFQCPSVSLGCREYASGLGVLCHGYVRARNWSNQWYGKETTLITEVARVLGPQGAESQGLPHVRLVEVADYAPLDHQGVLSGAPVIDTSGVTIGMWIDRAPYSRFFLPASEIELFLDRCDVTWH